MYVPFWIDEHASDPSKRVVVLRQFLDKPVAAWAVLRASLKAEKTGGVFAGTEEAITVCLKRIESKDESFPNDPSRIIAIITSIAKENGCEVMFKQNQDPLNSEARTIADTCGLSVESSFHPYDYVTSTLLSGAPEDLDTAQASIQKSTVQRLSPSLMVVKSPISAAVPKSEKSSFGLSWEVKLPMEALEEILGHAVMNKQKSRFVLLVRDGTRCNIFFGSESAYTIVQAIDQYVNHLKDLYVPPKGYDMDSSNEDGSSIELDDMDIERPPTGRCRFWQL